MLTLHCEHKRLPLGFSMRTLLRQSKYPHRVVAPRRTERVCRVCIRCSVFHKDAYETHEITPHIIVLLISQFTPTCLSLGCFLYISSIFSWIHKTSKCHLSPFSYFRSLIEQFEVQLQQYRQQIEELENHLTTQSSGSHITPQGKRLLKKYQLRIFEWFLGDFADLSLLIADEYLRTSF